jgi:hypothetical protein
MRAMTPVAFLVGFLLAQAPAPVTQLTATADCPPIGSTIVASITSTTRLNDTLSFACNALPPAIPSCPPPISIPAGYSYYGAGVVGVRLSYLGVPIVAMPGLTGGAPTIICPTCSWSNNLNSMPGDYMVAVAQLQPGNTPTFAQVTQEWSGYPASPQVSLQCAGNIIPLAQCQQIVTANAYGAVTVSVP